MSIALPAFGGIGIELEYAIVRQDSLDIEPVADRLLASAAGSTSTDVTRGMFGWSNELVLHVIEVKNLRPAPTLAGVAAAFAAEVAAIDTMLQQFDARLLPGAMHPWMNPVIESVLWPHENAAIYRQFDRIFDCKRHGWANLQSMHVNLPFAGDLEFARLHAAVRLVLPIIPALAASSPFAEGVDTGYADYRLEACRHNAALIPSIAGQVIPPTISSRDEYEETILSPIYHAIGPHDPEGTLQHEWLNSRGAIARFDRNAIEIRVTDTQECPRADLAIAGAINAVVRMLYMEDTATLFGQQAFPTMHLSGIFRKCTVSAERARLSGNEDAAYLALMGYPRSACTARQLWRHLLSRLPAEPGMDGWAMAALDHILEHGTLATRLRRAVGQPVAPTCMYLVYRDLADCLRAGQMFGRQTRTRR